MTLTANRDNLRGHVIFSRLERDVEEVKSEWDEKRKVSFILAKVIAITGEQ